LKVDIKRFTLNAAELGLVLDTQIYNKAQQKLSTKKLSQGSIEDEELF